MQVDGEHDFAVAMGFEAPRDQPRHEAAIGQRADPDLHIVLDHRAGLDRAAERPWTKEPSIWAAICFGLTARPQSADATMRRILSLPDASIEISTKAATWPP